MDIATIENSIIQGDSVDLLYRTPNDTFNAVIADPPYCSGGQFRGDRVQSTSAKYVQSGAVRTCRNEFTGDSRDQRSFLAWSTLWMTQALRVTKPGGIIAVFTDWRQLPTMTDAIQCGGWVWRNIATWWKPGCRMQKGRFSGSAEYVVYGSKGIPVDGEKAVQNVYSCPPLSGDSKDHIAQKPVEVLMWVLSVTPKDSLILDPFAGSGTACVAAERMRRRWVGIELLEENCETARRRIADERARPRMFAS